jgi:hypothetical protein
MGQRLGNCIDQELDTASDHKSSQNLGKHIKQNDFGLAQSFVKCDNKSRKCRGESHGKD